MKVDDVIQCAASALSDDYIHNKTISSGNCKLPSRETIIEVLNDIKKVIFPGYFGAEFGIASSAEYYAGRLLTKIYLELTPEIETALALESQNQTTDLHARAEDICQKLIASIPEIRHLLICDVEAGYQGDPAAKSKDEIIVSYPGLLAIFVYRVAHILYKENVPMIPRIMTEYAHSKTGIDINSGAEIGEYFFIDHGTGVVIGETTVIGNNVKLYQGVTLGALSTRSGQDLAGVKRHPTIGDHVTIYANSTVLGGETVIGTGSIIGGNAFITKSIPEHTKVIVKSPEMIFKLPTNQLEKWEI